MLFGYQEAIAAPVEIYKQLQSGFVPFIDAQ
jgi:hypothetical protein